MKHLTTLLLLTLLTTACIPVPCGDTRMHSYQIDHSGIATLTKVDGQIIDFLWQAENNTGEPVPYSDIDSADILGLSPERALSVGDRLQLEVLHDILQRGSSTPQAVKSIWSLGQ